MQEEQQQQECSQSAFCVQYAGQCPGRCRHPPPPTNTQIYLVTFGLDNYCFLRWPSYSVLLVRRRRTAACALIDSLAPENFAWLAQYFLGQLVGWGLALPEETDSEVTALVPAGDKLQKLHRRISTPSFGEVSL